MKKFLNFLFVLSILLSLCACGNNQQPDASTNEQELLKKYSELIGYMENGQYQEALSYVEGAMLSDLLVSKDNNQPEDAVKNSNGEDKTIPLDNPIVILDNEYVKIEIINKFQKFVGWYNGPDCIEKGITLNIYNKHDNKIRVAFKDTYVGNRMTTIYFNGDPTAVAGKTNTISCYIKYETGHVDEPLENIDDVLKLEGIVEIEEYYEEHAVREISSEHFSLS